MKKITAVLISLAVHNVYAQTGDSLPNVEVSAKAGYLQTALRGANVGAIIGNEKKPAGNGFMAGISIDNPINTRFGFQHELFFQQSGVQFRTLANNQEADATLTMNSIRLHPLSFTYRPGRLQLAAGPFVNMLTSSKLKIVDDDGRIYDSGDLFGSENDAQYDGQYLQKMDYGIVAGAEYRFNFGAIVGAQFSRGFASLFDNSNSYEADSSGNRNTLKIHRQQLFFFAGYRF